MLGEGFSNGLISHTIKADWAIFAHVLGSFDLGDKGDGSAVESTHRSTTIEDREAHRRFVRTNDVAHVFIKGRVETVDARRFIKPYVKDTLLDNVDGERGIEGKVVAGSRQATGEA